MHYEDTWEKDHRRKLEAELNAFNSRKQLFNILDSTQMIQIMFKDYLDKSHDTKVIKLLQESFEIQNKNQHKKSEVRVIETNLIISDTGEVTDHQSRVIVVSNWEEYIKSFCEYDGKPVFFQSIGSMTGASIGGEKQISNLEFDDYHMSCNIIGNFNDKYLAYLVR